MGVPVLQRLELRLAVRVRLSPHDDVERYGAVPLPGREELRRRLIGLRKAIEQFYWGPELYRLDLGHDLGRRAASAGRREQRAGCQGKRKP